MDIRNKPILPFLACGLISGLAVASPGCDAVGDLAEQCGLVCSSDGIAEGNASISGVASVDAFFGAVVSVNTAAANLEANIRGELELMAAELEIDATGMANAELLAAVKGELTARISANVDGSIVLKYAPPKCTASLEVTAEATAKCDVDVDPGSVEVSCEGSCQIDASAQADCRASGSLTCEGTAPNLECSGSCTGSCRLDVAASCEGTCNGSCSGTCSAENADGSCSGSCDGMCEGTCELKAGGSCSGSCEGSCKWDPGMVDCEAGASVQCEASAEANIECKGSCEGNVEPPEVSAECEASVKAEAKASMECTPPSLDIEFQFAAGVNAQAQGEFRAMIKSQINHFARIAAIADPINGKAKFVGEAAGDLIAAAGGAVEASIDTAASGDLDLKVSIGLACALAELKDVGGVLAGAQGSVQFSVSAFTEIGGALGNG
ncbi:MAG: hypothetical protein KC457_19270 [Myxococcales bacterium]|nr:hypothetical protein [Myxococcales bacterium]